MNYIRHLNKFFTAIQNDDNFTSSHLSLYMALFQYWNFNRFKNPFPIYRDNIMQLSKLAKNTYHKCLRELDNKYLYYHSPASKFNYARITIFPLGQEESEQPSKFQQLTINFDIAQSGPECVTNLIPTCRNFETDSVANLRHYIKPNIIKQQCVINNTHPPNTFLENKDKKTAKETASCHFQKRGAGDAGEVFSKDSLKKGYSPTLPEVQLFFQEQNYPNWEAEKFFHYNQSKNWMLTDRIPIKQWQSLARKWMLNAHSSIGNSKAGDSQSSQSFNHNHSSDLFSLYLSGKNISKLLHPEYFDELHLTLTEEILYLARQRRINQLSGSNERSELDLLHAYTNNKNDHLLSKDRSNLISLAKRLAVLNHFETLKSEGKTSLKES